MNEPELKDQPIYALEEDEENFALVRLSVVEEKHKTNWTKKTSCSIQLLHTNWKKAQEVDKNQEECAFYLSCLILTIAEGPLRKLLKRRSNPRLINIELVTETTAKYLKMAIEQIRKPSKKKSTIMNEKIKTPKMKELEEVIDKSLSEVRQKLGFPEVHPWEFSYKITPELIGNVSDPKCIKYLDSVSENAHIFSNGLEEICATLEHDFPEEAEGIIIDFKNTKSRDHLAVISISTENDQTYISIVNEQGKHVKMESWNFIRLIENAGTAFRLHEFVYRKSQSYIDPFTYNNIKTGCVVAKLNQNNSCLETACLSIPDESPGDRAVFHLDTTYVLCLYITLKRLENDKDRFNKLFSKSITFKPVSDPFLKFPSYY